MSNMNLNEMLRHLSWPARYHGEMGKVLDFISPASKQFEPNVRVQLICGAKHLLVVLHYSWIVASIRSSSPFQAFDFLKRK